jgi:IS30 family transposase
MSQKEIDKIVMSINRRPMKCLGFITPEAVFNENIRTLAGRISS